MNMNKQLFLKSMKLFSKTLVFGALIGLLSGITCKRSAHSALYSQENLIDWTEAQAVPATILIPIGFLKKLHIKWRALDEDISLSDGFASMLTTEQEEKLKQSLLGFMNAMRDFELKCARVLLIEHGKLSIQVSSHPQKKSLEELEASLQMVLGTQIYDLFGSQIVADLCREYPLIDGRDQFIQLMVDNSLTFLHVSTGHQKH